MRGALGRFSMASRVLTCNIYADQLQQQNMMARRWEKRGGKVPMGRVAPEASKEPREAHCLSTQLTNYQTHLHLQLNNHQPANQPTSSSISNM